MQQNSQNALRRSQGGLIDDGGSSGGGGMPVIDATSIYKMKVDAWEEWEVKFDNDDLELNPNKKAP